MRGSDFEAEGSGADRGAWEAHTPARRGVLRHPDRDPDRREPVVPSDTPPTSGRGAELYPLRDVGDVECGERVELVIFRFAGFGRLAHFRHWLLSLPHVTAARIAGYGGQTASFDLVVDRGIRSSALVPPGTRLLASDGHRVELSVEIP